MTAPVAIVAGSGIDLRPVLEQVAATVSFDAAAIPHGHVEGHAHCFHLGTRGNREIILQCGRLHAYEGFSSAEIVRPLAWLRGQGAESVIFTNAVGALRPEHAPGSLLAIEAIVPWPYRRFDLPDRLGTSFQVSGCDGAGDLVWMHGPCYETRAEIAALQRSGALAVGMSTAPELHHAQELGMAGAVVSCVTNNCCVLQKLTHAHVVETAARASARLCDIIGAWLDSPPDSALS
jgi:purine-nucleoside phosphorylase